VSHTLGDNLILLQCHHGLEAVLPGRCPWECIACQRRSSPSPHVSAPLGQQSCMSTSKDMHHTPCECTGRPHQATAQAHAHSCVHVSATCLVCMQITGSALGSASTRTALLRMHWATEEQLGPHGVHAFKLELHCSALV
jgi:hypothetical protein